MTRWIGLYRCRACGTEWKEEAGPVTCPKCPATAQWVGRIDWLNYEELRRGKT